LQLLRGGDAEKQAMAAQATHFLPAGEGAKARLEVEKIVREEGAPDLLFHALVRSSYLEPIEKLMQDPNMKASLKIRALRAMAERGEEKTIQAMGIALNDKAPEVRIASVEALGFVLGEASAPLLIKATEDGDERVRLEAVKRLAHFPGDDQVVKALGKALEDSKENVRRAAVDAFNGLGEPNEAMIKILKTSQKHGDAYVANKAGSILSRWNVN
jgi:HEAT repeat protein